MTLWPHHFLQKHCSLVSKGQAWSSWASSLLLTPFLVCSVLDTKAFLSCWTLTLGGKGSWVVGPSADQAAPSVITFGCTNGQSRKHTHTTLPQNSPSIRSGVLATGFCAISSESDVIQEIHMLCWKWLFLVVSFVDFVLKKRFCRFCTPP